MRALWMLVVGMAGSTAALAVEPAPAPAAGGEDVGNVRRKVEGPEEKPGEGPERPFSVEVVVEGKTAYLFRGYNVMDTGYIVQPEVTLSLRGAEWGPYSFAPYVGVWSNISETKGPDASPWSHWTEFDATGGVVVERGEWSLDVQWNYYVSPSDFFGRTHEVGATLAFGGNVFGVGLEPHVGVFRELLDRADGDENTYFEAGLEPELTLSEKWTLAVPLTVGMSLDGYYTDSRGRNSFFGYASVGARPAYQLDDHWSVYAGVEYVHLFADSVEAANGGDQGKVIGVVGVAFSY